MMWRLFNLLFGWQYVMLVFYDGDRQMRRAYVLGNQVYANPYLPETRCQLCPGGKIVGQCYISAWEPITDKTVQLYESDPAPVVRMVDREQNAG